jgi:hypothetical protein
MLNNKGNYTLEASIIVPFILIILVLLMSLVFTFFYKGYYETKLNQEIINKGYTIDHRDLKHMEIDIISFNKKTTIYQRKVDDHFLKGILLQDTIQFGKDWLDE